MAEAKKAKKTTTAAKSKKISDVSKKGTASPASRAIIVNNRPILKDPMMADDDTSEIKSKPVESDDSAIKVEVKRLGKKVSPKDAAAASKEEVSGPKVKADDEQPDDSAKTSDLTADELNEALRNLTQSSEKTEGKKDSSDEAFTEEGASTRVEDDDKTGVPELEEAQSKSESETEAGQADQDSEDKDEPADEETAEDEKPTAEEPNSNDDPEKAPSPGPEESETTDTDDTDDLNNSSSEDEAKPDEEDAIETTEPSNEKGNPNKSKQRQLTAEQIKAIESGQYFLPIQTLDNRRAKRDLIIFAVLSVVLVAVWLNVLLDAGLIELGNTEALTDFL